jgi:hypothetical protein
MATNDQLPVLEDMAQDQVENLNKENSRFGEWVLMTLLAWGSGYLFYVNSSFMKFQRDRLLICCAILLSGLITGIWVLVGLPGTFQRVGFSGYLLLGVLILISELVGGTIMWIIQSQLKKNRN